MGFLAVPFLKEVLDEIVIEGLQKKRSEDQEVNRIYVDEDEKEQVVFSILD